MRERDVQIEEQEVDHMAVQKTIGEISHDSGQEQGKRNVAQPVPGALPKEQRQDENKRDTGKDDEKPIVVPERSEGRSGVGDVNETKKIGDNDTQLLRVNVAEDEPFRDLVERVKRQRN